MKRGEIQFAPDPDHPDVWRVNLWLLHEDGRQFTSSHTTVLKALPEVIRDLSRQLQDHLSEEVTCGP